MERLFDYDMSLVTFTVSLNPTGGHFMNKLKRKYQEQVQCGKLSVIRKQKQACLGLLLTCSQYPLLFDRDTTGS